MVPMNMKGITFKSAVSKVRKKCTRLAGGSDKVFQLLAHGRWISGTPAFSTTKTGRHDKWWKKPEYPRSTDHGQATGKLYHFRLRVECIFFVIYKAGRESAPYCTKRLNHTRGYFRLPVL
jgi:hypothetical protein